MADFSLFGKWQAEEQLGDGTQAVAYRARSTGSVPEEAVIKWYVAVDSEDRFNREIEALRLLRTGGSPRLLEHGIKGGHPWLATRWEPGLAMDKWVDARGRPGLLSWLKMARTLSADLRDVHEAGILHRDIKPGNVIVRENGSATLIDFGYAVIDQRHSKTGSEHILGTLLFLAPERHTSSALEATEKSDVFSIGAALTLLALGEVPDEVKAWGQVLGSLGWIEAASALPESWRARFLTSCLAEQPDDRPSASEALGALEEVGREAGLNSGFVDLFAGGGGLALGFMSAGFRPLVRTDIDKFVAVTSERNFPGVPFILGDLSAAGIRQQVAAQVCEPPFLVAGGPPCPGFSLRNEASKDDPSYRLSSSFIAVVEVLKPRWVLFDLPPGLRRVGGERLLEQVVAEISNLGYANASYRLLDAAEFGVPQRKRRLVIIANRTGDAILWPEREFSDGVGELEGSFNPFRTVNGAITDLPDASAGGNLTCHELLEGASEGKHPDRRKLQGDRPATAISPVLMPVHPAIERVLTVREVARLQTFPDSIDFSDVRPKIQRLQVCSAMPPLLAERLAEAILNSSLNGLP
ncbi:MAG: protein kinase [Actinobacteria bacterium]|uniref:DNA (cytosine-5-)-methyltransferase n=1 Tax=freshwater metagenome TaxID=449393 RepID=A0A6J7J657_9ZZZZ|nr:protein kinase [Actinomycetota bacterium]